MEPWSRKSRGRGWQSGFRGSGSWREGKGRGSGSSIPDESMCRHFQRGQCRYGTKCKLFHDVSSQQTMQWPSNERPSRDEETIEQKIARADYNSWKKIIKCPPRSRDEWVGTQLWGGALAILDGEEREWKQMVPRDLDDEDYFGRQYLKQLLELRPPAEDSEKFVRLVRPFLLVITHPDLLSCLSVDTFVGSLYNFISGTNGDRAISFFKHACDRLVKPRTDAVRYEHTRTQYEAALIAIPIALRELVQRESRARFNDELPNLIEQLKVALQKISGSLCHTATSSKNPMDEIDAIVAGAKVLLHQEEGESHAPHVTSFASTYPQDIEMPRDRHDNDKADITKIKIFPSCDEIMSDAPDFLPSTNFDQPHFLTDSAQRHIDTQFRLMRHDTFGKLKDALGTLLHNVSLDPTCLSSPKLSLGDLRAYHYSNSYISYISFDGRRGLEASISFSQLHNLRKKSSSERNSWWTESKRLAEGTLLSFITISNDEIQHLFFTVTERSTDTKRDRSLTKENHQCTIITRLVSEDQPIVELMIRLSCQKARGLLIEFPGILPTTFVPILETLQDMQRLSRMPFRQWILPDRTDSPRELQQADIPPPLYARTPGFTFSWKSIARTKSNNLYHFTTSINPNSSVEHQEIINNLEAETDLDRGQCQALVAALTHEFALIQGPPGTGKSFLGVKLMSVLMDHKQMADLGPVIVVCYTNHALDQFLEHLLDVGIRKIIRIGGQSRSTILEDHNLRNLSKIKTKTKLEGYLLAKCYENLDRETKRIQTGLGRVHGILKGVNWPNIQQHILRQYPKISVQFQKIDDNGFQLVGRNPFDQWVPSEMPFHSLTNTIVSEETTNELNQIIQKAGRDIQSLSNNERCSLIKLWMREIHEQTVDDITESVTRTRASRKMLTNIHDDADLRILQGADVIGITTTGLAKRMSALRHIRCKVVICEEAGEVMEPHLLSALLPAVEHFIQIGDHEQLRPQINNYDLSLESREGRLYQLDRSQFERLSVGEVRIPRMPVAQLNVQRRMRPEISTLVRNTIYPSLIDHSSTSNFPDVPGMRSNVFWLDHNHLEEGQLAEMHHKSHSNLWEVEMLHALVRHIIRQGQYNSSEIAVLTPYTGQLQLIRSAMSEDFEIVLSDRDHDALEKDGFNVVKTAILGDDKEIKIDQRKTLLEKKKMSDLLRVATVDNFQGEEAKVIIVSLVRSNKDRKVGFLRTTNRINVLLSRAQHGMYLIGNTDTYSATSMWQQVINMLRASNAVGGTLDLCCPRHKNTIIQVSTPDDFPRRSPEGGCREACMWRLADCGHMCQARCHSESMHTIFSCPQPCQRLHEPCRHPCQKPTCGEDCGKCMIKLREVNLPCGHLKFDVLCHRAQDTGLIYCDHVVQKVVPRCNHTVEVACSQDITTDSYSCPTVCDAVLHCGHLCQGTCGKCLTKPGLGGPSVKHQKCRKLCGRRFGTCNHTCLKPCHVDKGCGLCSSPCEVRCQHSQCTLLCHEACAPCIEICTWSCEHKGSCRMPCSAPCDRLPCEQRCTKNLPCGHQCPGLCGEMCPEMCCHQCGAQKDRRVDLLEMKIYAEVDLNTTPIVALSCGHFFTAETLDGLIGMQEVYVSDSSGRFIELQDISGTLAAKIPQCPDCQCPVRQFATQRYNRVVNRAVIDELTKRFLVSGQEELNSLSNRVDQLQEEFQESKHYIIDTLKRTASLPWQFTKQIQTRYDESRPLSKDINLFFKKVADRNQPAQRLYEAMTHATIATSSKSLDEALVSLKVENAIPLPQRDHRVTLGGQMVQIKYKFVLLEDRLSIAGAIASRSLDEHVHLPALDLSTLSTTFLQECKTFIGDCNIENLPKFAVESSIYFARVAQFSQTMIGRHSIARETAGQYIGEARDFLEQSLKLCKLPFQNSEQLKVAVEDTAKLLRKEWYEVVTPEELASIKLGMVSGVRGIATHSGHWYNCANGHPFAIGECGMPMEEARCPECGAAIGGHNHQTVEGVTRARNMEI